MMASEFKIFTKRDVPQEEYFAPGHRACVGCGEALAVRLVCKAMGKDVIVSNATGCIEIISSLYPDTSWEVPWIHTLFENAAAVASGIEAGLKAMRRKGKIPDKRIKVVAMGGDGATSDIGLQAISGALERGHDLMYVCYDNEAYMNTGIQRSSATPYGASTTTSPAGKKSIGQYTWKKNMPEIAAAHNIPYVATASVGRPFDLIRKVQKGMQIEGPVYLHVFSPCPTGWRFKPDLSIAVAKKAVQTGVFPLYEGENGEYRLTVNIGELKPIEEYLNMQGRFRHLTDDDKQLIQERIKKEYEKLKAKCASTD